MLNISRRKLLRTIGSAMAASSISHPVRVWGAGSDLYDGDLLVTLQLRGGCDITCLCDPKMNTAGEPIINHWAEADETRQKGRLLYAPFAQNERLFNRFYRDMLVVNGVDTQTNSHQTGELFNWTGRNSEGMPSLSALFASQRAGDQPLAYSVFQSFSRTAGIVRFNQFNGLGAMSTITEPHRDDNQNLMRPPQELEAARISLENSLDNMEASGTLTPRQMRSLNNYREARGASSKLLHLNDILPPRDEFEQGEQFTVGDQMFGSNLKEQMQGALLIFESGLGAAADLSLGGFDSHDNHDAIHEALLSHIADALDYFWDEADARGLANRITMVIASDFGRTNMYNDGNGKDHWNTSSFMIIKRNAEWGNRTVGYSDNLHFAKGIHPKTLQPDDGGVILTPGHVHQALRTELGLQSYASRLGLTLRDVEDVAIFDSAKRTPQG